MAVEIAADQNVRLLRAAMMRAELQTAQSVLEGAVVEGHWVRSRHGKQTAERRAPAAKSVWGEIVMRPELLNPLFAPTASLKGVGPALEKPLERLGLTRVVDLLFHLPTGWTRRRPCRGADGGGVGRPHHGGRDAVRGGGESGTRTHPYLCAGRSGQHADARLLRRGGPLGAPATAAGRGEAGVRPE